jgi:cytidylate kinase
VTSRARPIVAIDGPAGAGKSTVARRLAEALGFVLVDTGAMYRVVALAAKRAGVAYDDGAALGKLARSLVAAHALAFEPDRGAGVAPDPSLRSGVPATGVRVRLVGEDVSEAIRAPDAGMGASAVSAHREVRDALLDMQRQAGCEGGVVLEGRDIGTVVFPDAEVKFFLTARPEVRARRRFDELLARGQSVTFDETLEEVRRRDAQDTERAVAPLKQAADAVLVDTSDLAIDEVVARMAARVRAATGAA